jgi:hypothetical protein
MFIDGWPKPASPNFRLKKTKFFKALELQIFWILLYIDLMSNISTVGAEAYINVEVTCSILQNYQNTHVRYLSSGLYVSNLKISCW